MNTTITRMETASEFLTLAQKALRRGDRREAGHYIGRAQEQLSLGLSTLPLTTLSPRDAARLEIVTIGESLNVEHLERVREAQRLSR